MELSYLPFSNGIVARHAPAQVHLDKLHRPPAAGSGSDLPASASFLLKASFPSPIFSPSSPPKTTRCLPDLKNTVTD